MKSVALKAHPRTLSRRKGAKAVRASGRIPAVIYGKHNPPQNLEVDVKEFDELVHRAHTEVILVDLAIGGDANGSRLAIVQDVQHHPLYDTTLHIDFHEVKADELVTMEIPVESVGTPDGVKNGGGTLEHVRFKLKIRALPGNLPEQITVDVSALKVGQTLHIGEIVAPEGVELMGDKKIPVFAVAAPVAEVAETTDPAAPAAADGKQPEMIKEKKADDAAAPKAAEKKK
jgi:large subunit ribosomal protein L25